MVNGALHGRTTNCTKRWAVNGPEVDPKGFENPLGLVSRCALCGPTRPAMNHRAQEPKNAEAPFFSPIGASANEPGSSGPGMIEVSPRRAQRPT